MSILLVGLDDDVAEELVRRLVAEGDEARIVVADRAGAARWRALGAYVAFGDASDDDLVERASYGVRTVAVGDGAALEPVLAGARRAGVDRAVVCRAGLDDATRAGLDASRMDYVVLVSTRRRRIAAPRRRRVAPDDVAAAIDAADDLAGNPRLELDLSDEGAWERLKLPQRK
ncbi:MAG TPA: hypothetical protein VHJ34_08375 [Actinomycetota bacterium]|nr:hypothetical protein [Actinomycetota bacterium]